MRCQQAQEIHQRLDMVLHLTRKGRYSMPVLAEDVGASIATTSRIVAALCEHGHDIHAERTRTSWQHGLANPADRGWRGLARRPVEAR